MLSELHVQQLGVIGDLSLLLGSGMTALTGETGAGKTLVVEALQLLCGGRSGAMLVRPDAKEALVEGRFLITGPDGETEIVLSRAVAAEGRSRAYVDGRMSTLAALAERGQALVDLHGQHAQQSLFSPAAQRRALDEFAGVEGEARRQARQAVRQLEHLMAEVGGDALARAREMEFLRYQLSELDAAAISGPEEDEELVAEEELLSGAAAHRAAAQEGYDVVMGEDGASDRLAQALGGLAGHPPLKALYERLRSVAAELADAGVELREASESLEDDPVRLAQVTARRAVLADLRRKYAGPGGSVPQVLAYHQEAVARLAYLEGLESQAEGLGVRHVEAMGELRRACQVIGERRRAAAPRLARAVEAELRQLAMPRARFDVRVESISDADDLGEVAGDDVTFLLAANPGAPLLPLAKVASGGELARAMLALRLVLLGSSDEPATLVFDEVDAGIGGEAALAVGRALAALSRRYQVIVVTHLAQVAAYAHQQVAVRKNDDGRATTAHALEVRGRDRVIELARMLSGQPGSETAQRHAEQLLTEVQQASPSPELR